MTETCPLCSSPRTHFGYIHSESEWPEQEFMHQRCANDLCSLPCKLWKAVAALKAEIERLTLERNDAITEGEAYVDLHRAAVENLERSSEAEEAAHAKLRADVAAWFKSLGSSKDLPAVPWSEIGKPIESPDCYDVAVTEIKP